jgi:ribosomal protein L32
MHLHDASTQVQTVPHVVCKQCRMWCANSVACGVQTVSHVVCKQCRMWCANSVVCGVQKKQPTHCHTHLQAAIQACDLLLLVLKRLF